ncbi:hypothetical protein [Motilimonas cestriensis]|uniref:hypothetical protein n=1 Tax=Motilimonas cestriensis TaxID=2742685 RepID=UPI003DA54542
MMTDHAAIDVPFSFRHQCWFCAEPSKQSLNFPLHEDEIALCEHIPLQLPCCPECLSIAKQHKWSTTHIDMFRSKLKKALALRYKKHLDIGNNWTKEELEQSEFNGKAFEGFKKSAWMMFEIAQGRMEFQGWPIIVNGLEISAFTQPSFSFDGEEFPHLEAAVQEYAKRFQINSTYLSAVVDKIGSTRFSAAIRHCRIHPLDEPEDLALLVSLVN